ncbi:glucosamine-6-phosphate deaminase [Halarsenatibacter silvermanii]|uniref:Glucosamine-6-phosphate deaminase n=1 Tax=Halarsenatibacter silvermanii TaxID=321763 RepID=A0A1G9MBX7_9FIRM|nr:glucosamine-6-phosphate deaminase [Halarsenatibacter silvermanii]SDL71511.1 glucosamine-6-phosphate deaminase [Halarsenatibacter silvermanii]
MNLIIAENYGEMSQKAAGIIEGMINFNPRTLLGLPTGSTPIGMYDRLIEAYRQGRVSFSEVTTFNLDEYAGIPADHQGSLRTYMENNFFQGVDLLPENRHIPEGDSDDLEEECQRYEDKITRAGGIDLQILGIGANGHIAFNEPGEEFPLKTGVVELSEHTRRVNRSNFFDEEKMPRKAITMGLGTILSAEKILLMANGESKARAVELMLEEKIRTGIPASFLHLHDNVTVILDREAAKNI